MSDKDQWVELVQKLNTQTQDGKLSWVKDVLPTISTNALANSLFNNGAESYSVRYGVKGFKISRQIAAFNSKSESRIISIKLDITDETGEPVWRVPDVVGISDLYQTVKMQSAGVKQFVDDFLRD